MPFLRSFITCFLALFLPIQPLLLLSFSSLYYLCLSPLSFLTVAANGLSHVLQVWLCSNPGGDCWENISGYRRLSGYVPYQFLQLALLKSWMKNDNPPAPTQRKQVGESCSLAIRNLTQALKAACWSPLRTPASSVWSKASLDQRHLKEMLGRGPNGNWSGLV